MKLHITSLKDCQASWLFMIIFANLQPTSVTNNF